MKGISDSSFKNELTKRISYVYSITFRIIGNIEESKDIAQDSLLIAWEKRFQLKEIEALPAWLKTIVINRIKMYFRKKEIIIYKDSESIENQTEITEFKIDTEIPTALDELIMDEAVIAMRNGCFNAIALKLKINQRIVFVLIDIFGMKIKDVSQLLEISDSAIKSLLFRARKNINAFYGHYCQWVLPDNPCKCVSWKRFVDEKNELQFEKIQLDTLEHVKKHDPLTLSRTMQLFRKLPLMDPGNSFLKEMKEKLTKIISSS